MDAAVSEPYGINLAKKDNDHLETIKLEEKFFPEICRILNQYHGTSHESRYWSIIIGPWYKKIIKVILNRHNTLEKCLLENEISGTTSFFDNGYNLATLNYLSSYEAFSDDLWNNVLTTRIMKLSEKLNFKIDYIDHNKNLDIYPGFYSSISKTTKLKNKNFLKLCFDLYSKISRKFIRDNDAFIINSYLPLKSEIKLELSLGQWPQIWKYQWSKFYNWTEIIKHPDKLLRKKLSEKFEIKSNTNIENILCSLLFELLPVCYLEGFMDLQKIVDKQPWPKSPKFIFTSSNFNADEVFKLWTANQINSGTKYYIGQHGSQYATFKYKIKMLEETTSDKFITWGWTNYLKQHNPAFILNIAGKKRKSYNPNGGLLLIETIIDVRFTTWDIHSEYIDYLNEQKNFVNNLDYLPKKNLTIRLHSGFKLMNKNLNEDHRLLDFDSSLKIDNGIKNIDNLISKSRLIVYSYDSTGVLENLSQNIPTLVFWNNVLEEMSENAKPYYQLLVDAGIVHMSAKSVTNKINEIWDDVDGWWQQRHVQDARKKFCDRYAKTSHNPISELKQILLS